MITLYIENQEIELDKDVVVQITKTFEQLSDPTSYKNDYSKTVSVPSTAHNDKVFNYVFSADAYIKTKKDTRPILDYFDPTRRLDMRLTYNAASIIDGYAKFNRVVRTNGLVRYELSLFGSLGKVLNDLNRVTFDTERTDGLHIQAIDDRYMDGREYRITLNRDEMHRFFTIDGELDKGDLFRQYGIGFAPNMGVFDDFDAKSIQVSDFQEKETDEKPISGITEITKVLEHTDAFVNSGYTADSVVGDGISVRGMSQFRSYMQLPYISMKKLFGLCLDTYSDFTDNAWKYSFEGEWFNSDNPYWKRLVMMLNPISEIPQSEKTNTYEDGNNDTYRNVPTRYNLAERFQATTSVWHERLFFEPKSEAQQMLKDDSFRPSEGDMLNISFQLHPVIRVDFPDGTDVHTMPWNVKTRQEGDNTVAYGANPGLVARVSLWVETDSGEERMLPGREQVFWVGNPVMSEVNGFGPDEESTASQLSRPLSNLINTKDSMPTEYSLGWCDLTKVLAEYRPSKGIESVDTANRQGFVTDIYLPIQFNNVSAAEVAQSTLYQGLTETPKFFIKVDYTSAAGYNTTGSSTDPRQDLTFKWTNAEGATVTPEPISLFVQTNTSDLTIKIGREKHTNLSVNLSDLFGSCKEPWKLCLDYMKMFRIGMFINEKEHFVVFKRIVDGLRDYEIKDMTDHVHFDKDYTITPCNFNERYIRFAYKESDDKLHKDYKDFTGFDYGEFVLDDKYQFNEKTKDLFEKSEFQSPMTYSPTALAWPNAISGNIVYLQSPLEAFVSSVDGIDTVNPFGILLFDEGVKNFDGGYGTVYLTDDTPLQNATNTFCYIGDAVDSNNKYRAFMKECNSYHKLTCMTEYMNTKLTTFFAVPRLSYDSSESGRFDDAVGIYELVWKNWLSERYSSQSKVVTCYVDLSDDDFSDFEFRKFWRVGNQVYFVNKIYDFNVGSGALTKVDLMCVGDLSNYISDNFSEWFE